MRKYRMSGMTRLSDQDYSTMPVTDKYLCVVIKTSVNDLFIVTAYFTDAIKRGKILWIKK